MAKPIEWRKFLGRWSRDLMATPLASCVEPSPVSSEWLGFDPATAQAIAALEARLGVTLPPSYESFLLASDGWRRTTSHVARLRPAAEVNWFRVENEQWAEVYGEAGSELPDEAYFAYAEDGAPDHRAAHMSSLLQISDVDDGVYLLNPEAVTPDGEWEAWFFANWVPGAVRYPSFAHLMLGQYRAFANVHGLAPAAARGLPKLKTPPPDVPRVPAARVRTSKPKAPSLESLIHLMRVTADPKARVKAIRTFAGKLRGRPRATRRPDLVPVLAETFYAAGDPGVRASCVAALTELAEDGEPPRALLDALSDADPSVVLSGIFALHYFPDRRAIEPLCRFVESRANTLYNENAMSALGQFGDARAVPTLVGVLLDTGNPFEQNFCTAAQALARCGAAGVGALIEASDHVDPRVRHAAVVGLDVSGNHRAAALLDRMRNDPDEKVASRARMRVGKPSWGG